MLTNSRIPRPRNDDNHSVSQCIAELSEKLQTEAAIGDVNLTGREAGFVGREMDGQSCNLFGSAQSSHWLPRDKFFMNSLHITLRSDPLIQ